MERPSDDKCVAYTGGLRLSVSKSDGYDNEHDKAPLKCCDHVPVPVNSILPSSVTLHVSIYNITHLHIESPSY